MRNSNKATTQKSGDDDPFKAALRRSGIVVDEERREAPEVKKKPVEPKAQKKPTIESELKGVGRSTVELYQNVEQIISSLMYEEEPGGAYFDGKISDRLKGTVWNRIKQAVNVTDKRYLSEKLADEILNAAVSYEKRAQQNSRNSSLPPPLSGEEVAGEETAPRSS